MRPSPQHRTHPAKAKRALVRGADGRLRPAGRETEIADVWEQQRRLKLNQAINDQRKRAELKRLRRERGFVGLATLHVQRALRKTKAVLFGLPKSTPKAVSKLTTPASDPSHSYPAPTKNVEIVIAMPSLPGKRLKYASAKFIRRLGVRFKTGPFQKPRNAALAICTIATIAGAAFWHSASSTNNQPPQTDVKAASSGKPTALQKGTPEYRTLLPVGKSIESLGGWTRISPPDRNPVYAYTDTIGSIRISVSQQPLPEEFAKNATIKVKELAQSYGADETFTADKVTVHIGTSAKGPQSVIFSHNQLLILIKSSAPMENGQWTSYISSLQ